ncbi:D-glycero-beta-D-manno-heptose 1,7-bisphosphate 7-phosphatase [Salinisphaera sp. Q1T1-3]|uniref:D-glycero-beta-D-manno-heptose 1,7-bisphosphate 7-phosphatase n=1 Tax=Salinisphaera sp. Q1T1-3 TaxID=2321229 RepID=UPI000E748D1E|nr:D-glycero-beta-D-manno-heptose 1,7-bisphosphate 7-phosphatase [Salinisphaera sp. Q1T1-3]RJS92562.1 D-glycero-beta-D-manno-heptose 1,7-bisphosphate 7-phosphatase [Salinisphaera sp. Q1T1-3]
MTLSTVVLDRDGVINRDSEAFIKSPAEWHAIPGSLEAIARLRHAGLRVMVATNQSGLGRGLFEYDALLAMHEKMTRQLADLGVALDGVFFCPHTAEAGCMCRKPATGMLDDIMSRWHLAATECVMVGDSPTDIQAAHAAGMAALGVRTGKPIDTDDQRWASVAMFDDLTGAVEHILAERVRHSTEG